MVLRSVKDGHETHRLIWVWACGFAVLGLCGYIYWVHRQEIERDRVHQTRNRLYLFATVLESYAIDHGHWPGLSRNDVESALTNGDYGSFLSGMAPESHWKAEDFFGHDLKFSLNQDGSFTIQSFGPDGVDDGGKGDDIVRTTQHKSVL